MQKFELILPALLSLSDVQLCPTASTNIHSQYSHLIITHLAHWPRPFRYSKTWHAARESLSMYSSGVLLNDKQVLRSRHTVLVFGEGLLHDKF
jgi:hypothetical protein